MITKLTPEQEAELPAFRASYLEKACDGDSCLCTRRCEWCQPLTATELAERQALRDVMASALAGEHQPKEASNGDL